MAIDIHLEIFNEGVDEWNKWREEEPLVIPDLSGANLSGRSLKSINLTSTKLIDTNFSGCELQTSEFFKCNAENANFSDTYLVDAQLAEANMNGATFQRANLYNSNLASSDFHEADFSEATLSDGDLSETKLTRANFGSAHLQRVDFRLANLTGANFQKANLEGAIFIQSILQDSCFDMSILGYNIFSDANLGNVISLENADHRGPSSIDFQSLAISGDLPINFLRGCGLPEGYIEYLPSLLNKPFQFFSCFISYSVKDNQFAERLYSDLQNSGVRCWYAPEDMKIGDKIRERIDQSIKVYDKLLIILSKNSLDSAWVEKEVETAFEEERKREDTILFPIRLDDRVMETSKAWASDIRRTRHIGDFREWKNHDDYKDSFNKLLKDLKGNVDPVGSDEIWDDEIPF